MTQTYSRPRQQAEIAFARVQSQFLGRDRAGAEIDLIARLRKEKTLRLKNARVARESEKRAKVADWLLSRRTQIA